MHKKHHWQAEWQSLAHERYRDDACRFALPKEREDATIQLFRLMQALGFIIDESRRAAPAAGADGGDGTNDLRASDILRRNELPVWFISNQLAGAGVAGKDHQAAGSPAKAHA